MSYGPYMDHDDDDDLDDDNDDDDDDNNDPVQLGSRWRLCLRRHHCLKSHLLQ